MGFCTKALTYTLLLFFAIEHGHAQQYSSAGKEFLVSFISIVPTSVGIGGHALEITISTKKKNVDIQIRNIIKSGSYSITGLSDTSVTIQLTNTTTNNTCVPDSVEQPEYCALRISSTDTITVYAMSSRSAISDGTLVLPNNVLGTDYFLPSYQGASTLGISTGIIVATEDNTVVEIIPSTETFKGKKAGVPFTITLQKEQTYKITAKIGGDLTGTQIRCTNNKKIGVFGGNICVNVPSSCAACDMIYEHVPPVSALGKKYLMAPPSIDTLIPIYGWRVIASKDSTNIYVDGSFIKKLNRGEHHTELAQAGPIFIEADQPVLTIQYTLGTTCAKVGIGDPSMVVIPPIEQVTTSVQYNTASYSTYNRHYIYIITQSSGTSSVKVNDTLIKPGLFKPFPFNTAYSYVAIPRAKGSHVVESPLGFIMVAYGYGNAIAYSFIGGSSFRNLNHDIEINGLECGVLNFGFKATGDTALIDKSYWDFGDGTTDTGLSVKKTYAVHGTYTIKNVAVSGGSNPIVDTVSKTIITLPKPEAKISIVNENVCFNENFTILRDGSDYKGMGKNGTRWWYTDTPWVQTNVDTITRIYSRPNFSKTNGIGDSVVLIITAANGCTDTTFYNPQVKHSVNADFAVLGSQCLKENVFTPVSTATIDDGFTSIGGIRWDFGDGTTDTGAFPIKRYLDTGTYKIRMVALAYPSLCHDTVYNTFTVLPSPVASFTTADVCYRDSTLLQNTSTIKSGFIKYNWSFGDGNTDTVRQKNYLYADTGKFTIKQVAISDWMCTDTFQKTIHIKPKPNAMFSYGNYCEKNAVQFTDNTRRYNVPGLNNYWVFGNGSTAFANGNASYTYNTPGTYTVKLVAEGANGCKDSISKNIYVNPIPSVDFTVNKPGQCLKENLFIFASDTKISSGSIVGRQWYINSQPHVSGFSAIKTFTTDGLYNIKLVAITDSACADSVIKPITVYPQANLAIGVNDPQQCLSTNLFIFSNNSYIAAGSINYTWSFSSGVILAAETPPAQTFPVPGLYDVWLMSESDKGCKDTINERVTVDYNPKADFVTQTICENDSAVFVNTTLGAAGGWLWDFGDGATSTLEKPSHLFSGPGIYRVSLVGVSGNGCSDTVTKDSGVIVKPAPNVYFKADVPGNINGITSVKFTNFTQFGNNYSWSFGNGNFSRSVHPVENYTDTGYYKVSLSAINDDNCFSEYDTLLYIAPDFDLHIPNAFSPNKDPLNSVFKVEGTYYYKSFDMYIYDGWGGLLFYTDNPNNGWDGKKGGEPLPQGAYLYYIRMVGTNRELNTYRGTVYLLH